MYFSDEALVMFSSNRLLLSPSGSKTEQRFDAPKSSSNPHKSLYYVNVNHCQPRMNELLDDQLVAQHRTLP
jgi:hypothetical protein